MQSILLISGTVLGLFLLAYPFFSGNAQKVENVNKMQEKDSALEAIKKSVVANSFYNKLQQGEKAKDYQWNLIKANYDGNERRSLGGDLGKETRMVFKRQSSEVSASIIEYKSVDEAKSPLSIRLSQGSIKNCKGDLCGDEGREIYGSRGFHNLEFRRDNYFVYITCDSEETAMRFADYALKAIAEK